METEKILSDVEAVLRAEQIRLIEVRQSLERCERDELPRLPMVRMYERPKFLPKDC